MLTEDSQVSSSSDSHWPLPSNILAVSLSGCQECMYPSSCLGYNGNYKVLFVTRELILEGKIHREYLIWVVSELLLGDNPEGRVL